MTKTKTKGKPEVDYEVVDKGSTVTLSTTKHEVATKEAIEEKPMNEEDVEELASCEEVIQKGIETFIEVGLKLAIVRAKQLYRKDYKSFEQYVEVRWNMTKQRAYQLMSASSAHRELSYFYDTKMLPTDERSMRELMRVPDEKIADVLEDAAADGKVTAKSISEAMEKHVPKKPTQEKAKKVAPIKIETALKAAEKWSSFLVGCVVAGLSDEQKKLLLAAIKKAEAATKNLKIAA